MSTTGIKASEGWAAPPEPWILLGKHLENGDWDVLRGWAAPLEPWIVHGRHSKMLFREACSDVGGAAGTMDFAWKALKMLCSWGSFRGGHAPLEPLILLAGIEKIALILLGRL